MRDKADDEFPLHLSGISIPMELQVFCGNKTLDLSLSSHTVDIQQKKSWRASMECCIATRDLDTCEPCRVTTSCRSGPPTRKLLNIIPLTSMLGSGSSPKWMIR